MRKSVAMLVALAAAVLAPAALADTNPSFETGDFTDWSVNAPSGSASVEPGGAPGGGNYFGVVGAGAQDEYQTISTTVSLQAGDAVTAAALFYNAEGAGSCFFDDQGDVLVMLDGNVVGTILAGSSCSSDFGGAGSWGGNVVYVGQDGVYTVVARVKNVGDGSVASQVWLDALSKRTPRAGYCAGAGNTAPDGTAIVPGSFLELRPGQPATDAHYTGATLAHFVEGKGLTCDAPPAGYVQSGLAGDAQHVPDGLYAYYKAP